MSSVAERAAAQMNGLTRLLAELVAADDERAARVTPVASFQYLLTGIHEAPSIPDLYRAMASASSALSLSWEGHYTADEVRDVLRAFGSAFRARRQELNDLIGLIGRGPMGDGLWSRVFMGPWAA